MGAAKGEGDDKGVNRNFLGHIWLWFGASMTDGFVVFQRS